MRRIDVKHNPLHELCKTKDYASLCMQLESLAPNEISAFIQEPNSDGASSLHLAVYYGTDAMVQVMLDHLTSEQILQIARIQTANTAWPSGSLLDLVVMYGSSAMLRAILEKLADSLAEVALMPLSGNCEGWTPLQKPFNFLGNYLRTASRVNHDRVNNMIMLIDAMDIESAVLGLRPLTTADDYFGWTALQLAVLHGEIMYVQAILRHLNAEQMHQAMAMALQTQGSFNFLNAVHIAIRCSSSYTIKSWDMINVVIAALGEQKCAVLLQEITGGKWHGYTALHLAARYASLHDVERICAAVPPEEYPEIYMLRVEGKTPLEWLEILEFRYDFINSIKERLVVGFFQKLHNDVNLQQEAVQFCVEHKEQLTQALFKHCDDHPEEAIVTLKQAIVQKHPLGQVFTAQREMGGILLNMFYTRDTDAVRAIRNKLADVQQYAETQRSEHAMELSRLW